MGGRPRRGRRALCAGRGRARRRPVGDRLLEAPDIYVLDRSQSEGAATYQADSERMDTISTVFPFMLFLVAALVALTTMTRMVEDERVQMGTYKALGYSSWRIAGALSHVRRAGLDDRCRSGHRGTPPRCFPTW